MCLLGKYVRTHALSQGEAIQAFRVWNCSRFSPQLRSTWLTNGLWDSSRDVYTADAVPTRRNTNGIHAFSAKKSLRQHYAHMHTAVHGVVWLFGRVLEFEHGYRAEHAVIEQLYYFRNVLPDALRAAYEVSSV